MNYFKNFSLSVFFMCLFVGFSPAKSFFKMYEGAARSTIEVTVLNVPFNIEIISIDGAKPRKGLLNVSNKANYSYHILPGRHSFKLRYNDIWESEQNEDDYEKIKSEIVELSFESYPGQILKVLFDKPTSLDDALKLEKKFSASIVESGQIEKIASAKVDRSQSVGSWVRDEDLVIKSSDKKNISNALNSYETKEKPMYSSVEKKSFMSQQSHSIEIESQKKLGKASKQIDSLEMLKFWWGKASSSERRDFLNWSK